MKNKCSKRIRSKRIRSKRIRSKHYKNNMLGGKHTCETSKSCATHQYNRHGALLCNTHSRLLGMGAHYCSINTHLFIPIVNQLCDCVVIDRDNMFILTINPIQPQKTELYSYTTLLSTLGITPKYTKREKLPGVTNELISIFGDLNGLTNNYKYSLFMGQFLNDSGNNIIIKRFLNNDYQYFIELLVTKYKKANPSVTESMLLEEKNKLLFMYSRLTLDQNCEDTICDTIYKIKVNDELINTTDAEFKIYRVTGIDVSLNASLLDAINKLNNMRRDTYTYPDIDWDLIIDYIMFHTNNSDKYSQYIAKINEKINEKINTDNLTLIVGEIIELKKQIKSGDHEYTVVELNAVSPTKQIMKPGKNIRKVYKYGSRIDFLRFNRLDVIDKPTSFDIDRWSNNDIFTNDMIYLFFMNQNENYDDVHIFTPEIIDKYIECVTDTSIDAQDRLEKTYFTLQTYIDTKIINEFNRSDQQHNNHILLFILFGILLYVFSEIRNTDYSTLGSEQKKLYMSLAIEPIYYLQPIFKQLLQIKSESDQIEKLIFFLRAYVNDLPYLLDQMNTFVHNNVNKTFLDKLKLATLDETTQITKKIKELPWAIMELSPKQIILNMWRDFNTEIQHAKKKPFLLTITILTVGLAIAMSVYPLINGASNSKPPSTVSPLIHSTKGTPTPITAIPTTFTCVDGSDKSSCAAQQIWHTMVTTEFAPIGPHNDPALRNLTKPQPQPEPRKTVDLCAPTGQHHNLCANNLGIPRYNMPQMPGDPTKINEILDNLKSNHNITHTQTENMENLLIRNLKPSQKEVNEGKAMGIAREMTMNVFPNGYIFISNDGYIIDGHHRWFAYMIADRTDGMGVIQINAPIARILQLLSAETRDTPTLSMNDTPWRLLPV